MLSKGSLLVAFFSSPVKFACWAQTRSNNAPEGGCLSWFSVQAAIPNEEGETFVFESIDAIAHPLEIEYNHRSSPTCQWKK